MLYLFLIFVYNKYIDVHKTVISIITHIFFNVKGMKRNNMKICAVICEYNPFHNGHLYQLQEAKKRSGADAILCIMSGNFVQRGEAAVLHKSVRAKHAVLGGADAVIELPTVFATSNAELFAKGAVSLLASIPSVTTLCFGAENADKDLFFKAAELLNHEPPSVSAKIKEYVGDGMSYAKARTKAWAGLIDENFLSSPNNILGLEYTKALLDKGANIDILPIQRMGEGYNSDKLAENFSSASAIRNAIQQGNVLTSNLPDYVKKDLPNYLENRLETLEKFAIIERPLTKIANVCDCSEGLENALKKAALLAAPLTETLTSARYTSSRIRRIALQNLLKIEETLIRESLSAPLYLRILAAKKERSDILSALAESNFPILARAHDENALSDVAKSVYEIDSFAENVYFLLYPQSRNKNMFI